MELPLNVNLSEIALARAKSFFSFYEIESVIYDTDAKIFLGEASTKKCRFCKKTSQEVKFRKDAHVIPQFMGNTNLLSYFECDSCNSFFSKYEDSFANFIGINRTVFGLHSKKKAPKFKSNKTGLEITTSEKGLNLKINGDLGDEVIINDESKTMTINSVRPSYIPMYIPKLLLKIAFSMLSEKELEDYELLRQFLMSDDLNDKFEGNQLLKVYVYVFPGPPLLKPKALLYTKKQNSSELQVPHKQIILHFLNYVYQICLPYSTLDKEMIGKVSTFNIYPLIMDEEYYKRYGNATEHYLDFSTHVKRINEKQEIKFTFQERVRGI